jgi:hypothetical protein
VLLIVGEQVRIIYINSAKSSCPLFVFSSFYTKGEVNPWLNYQNCPQINTEKFKTKIIHYLYNIIFVTKKLLRISSNGLPLETKIHDNYTHNFIFYLTENKSRVYYKDKTVNADWVSIAYLK